MFKGICFNFHCGLAMVGPQTYYSFLLKLSLFQLVVTIAQNTDLAETGILVYLGYPCFVDTSKWLETFGLWPYQPVSIAD